RVVSHGMVAVTLNRVQPVLPRSGGYVCESVRLSKNNGVDRPSSPSIRNHNEHRSFGLAKLDFRYPSTLTVSWVKLVSHTAGEVRCSLTKNRRVTTPNSLGVIPFSGPSIRRQLGG